MYVIWRHSQVYFVFINKKRDFSDLKQDGLYELYKVFITGEEMDNVIPSN